VKDVVTGAFSYTGRHIAERLLAAGREVTTLTRTVPDPLPLPVATAPLQFADRGRLVAALAGADTLYNTFWIRFPHGAMTFERAVESSRVLFDAAAEAGVRRIVHVSVTKASYDSPYAYFRGKAAVENTLREAGPVWSIVRPTLVFGPQDILVSNIAWILRRFPLFLVPGRGDYLVQPVSVQDVARLCVEAPDGAVLDAAGPDTLRFDELVHAVGRAVGGRARIVHAPPALALGLTRAAGRLLRDVVLSHEELAGLMDSLLTSDEPPLGRDRFADWLAAEGPALGRHYVSELARNWRGTDSAVPISGCRAPLATRLK
jgi:NADH dehydrogenase